MAGSLIKIDEEIVTSAVASVTLGGSDWDSSYDVYMVNAYNVKCATDNIFFNLRVLASGTEQTTSNYDWAGKVLRSGLTFTNQYGTNQNHMRLTGNPLGSATNEVGNHTLYLFNFNNSSEYSFITQEGAYQNTVNNVEGNAGGFVYTVTEAHNGLLFYASSGNIDSGTFTLYGLRK